MFGIISKNGRSLSGRANWLRSSQTMKLFVLPLRAESLTQKQKHWTMYVGLSLQLIYDNQHHWTLFQSLTMSITQASLTLLLAWNFLSSMVVAAIKFDEGRFRYLLHIPWIRMSLRSAKKRLFNGLPQLQEWWKLEAKTSLSFIKYSCNNRAINNYKSYKKH